MGFSQVISNIHIASLYRMITPKPLRVISVGITNAIQNVGYFFSGLFIGLILDSSQPNT